MKVLLTDALLCPHHHQPANFSKWDAEVRQQLEQWINARGNPTDIAGLEAEKKKKAATDAVTAFFGLSTTLHDEKLSLWNLAEAGLTKAMLKRRAKTKQHEINHSHIRSYEVPGNDRLSLLFEEIHKSCTFESGIRYEQLHVESVRDAVSIPWQDFDALHNVLPIKLGEEATASQKAGYWPYSYLKVHVESWSIGNMDAGNHRQISFYLKVSSIPYFTHCIFRKYFNRQYSDVPPTEEEFTRQRGLYVPDVSGMQSYGSREPTELFFAMAGCGVWVLSSDNYLMVSVRGKLYEISERIGYTASGSCEYTNRLWEEARKKGFVVSGDSAQDQDRLEANPFKTASRELWEECMLQAAPADLRLISFGLDYERYLQQFSFFYQSRNNAHTLLERSKGAVSINEQILIAVPFQPSHIARLISTYEMEPGAIVSLLNLCRQYFPDSFAHEPA